MSLTNCSFPLKLYSTRLKVNSLDTLDKCQILFSFRFLEETCRYFEHVFFF